MREAKNNWSIIDWLIDQHIFTSFDNRFVIQVIRSKNVRHLAGLTCFLYCVSSLCFGLHFWPFSDKFNNWQIGEY